MHQGTEDDQYIKKQLEEQENKEGSDQEEEEIRQKGDWHQQLLKASQKGDYDHVKKCLDKKANPLVECKKKWNPIIWAACRGWTKIVRLLISRGGIQVYLQENLPINVSQVSQNSQYPSSPKHQQQQVNVAKKVVMGIINNQIKQTPLQWACFKGHLQIVWLLLKAGLSWDDIDPFGNNCVHLAASGGNLAVFQVLLMYGVSVTQQNSRGHTAKDLATNREIISLIKQLEYYEKNEPLRKYWCMTTKEFYKAEDYKLEWMYEDEKSTEKEKPEGRCLQAWKNIQQTTEELLDIIQKQDHKLLTDKLVSIETQKIEVDSKTLEYARIQQEKLRTQNVIYNFLNGLKHVDNYKTIMKSVNTIKDMLEDAVKRDVQIDKQVISQAKFEMNRLISERNLRFELDNLELSQSVQEQVQSLQERMDDAKERGVENEYIQHAEVLKENMTKNIQFKKILKMFAEYPVRDYPDPIKIDPRTKKPIDPVSGKPIEPLQLALNNLKNKKKKDPKFTIPEWANEIKALEDNVKSIETLMKEKEKIDLTPEFMQKANENISRMKREINYRKQLEEEAKLILDAKNAAKKKNK